MHIRSVSARSLSPATIVDDWLQISLGLDNPRRITYHNMLKMYGVACVRSEPIRHGEPEFVASSFKILSDTSFSRKSCTVHFFHLQDTQRLIVIQRIGSV